MINFVLFEFLQNLFFLTVLLTEGFVILLLFAPFRAKSFLKSFLFFRFGISLIALAYISDFHSVGFSVGNLVVQEICEFTFHKAAFIF